ncbi:hypothetical protein CDAR_388631 [Caerostris darwini]|uniref:Uncharacterized protein n=2 Tax=Caerostris TaxID=172845 RepID=A0AAV4S2S7_9ARAC|nr:hypothetical protein CDAR_388631 [Caerostris darwini]GIY37905.1 hypothetical protein CEXT_413091 [Caerostris extrusa]
MEGRNAFEIHEKGFSDSLHLLDKFSVTTYLMILSSFNNTKAQTHSCVQTAALFMQLVLLVIFVHELYAGMGKDISDIPIQSLITAACIPVYE